jgi:hypothetical protein
MILLAVNKNPGYTTFVYMPAHKIITMIFFLKTGGSSGEMAQLQHLTVQIISIG